MLRNAWYMLEADTKGAIKVKSKSGETILSSLDYFSSYRNYGGNLGLINNSASLINDSTLLIMGEGNGDNLVKIFLTVCKNVARLDVTVETVYNSDLIIERESLIAQFAIPITGIYLKNSELALKPFEREYWLDKQGVRFGAGETSSLIYHTTDISSLQLNTKEKQVIINLDFVLDHPMIHIPYHENGGGYWIDKSASEFTQGMVRSDHFALYFGNSHEVIPRLMNVPYGYLAGYVFTEHADCGNIRTHRAAYFGSENISGFQNATGGFVGHDIPVTKSVFYEDFDGVYDGLTDNHIKEEQLLDFLDQLYVSGNYELCLHTPENGNSDRKMLEEAIKFMKGRYDAITWIDHGMFQGIHNREALVADGMDSLSVFYSADLWEQYDTRYFWSSAVEKIRFSVPVVSMKENLMKLRFQKFFIEFSKRYRYFKIYKDLEGLRSLRKIIGGNFSNLELNSQQPFAGSSAPTPLYWQNQTVTREFYSWPTEFVYNGVTLRLDEANLPSEKQYLEMLIHHRGIFFNHGYYVRNIDKDDILDNYNGELRINPWFDKILAYMDQRRDDGDLYITTVRDLLNYWRMLENISFDYLPDGAIRIINHNNTDVKGFSIALHASPGDLTVNGEKPFSRKIGDDIIVWFDLPSEEEAVLQISQNMLHIIEAQKQID
ncbi:MAG TPA: hypothetical protein DDW27_09075 [Bacteroidales bacterium]|nr:hypothetical protein [Bacteroidales bacterium]